MSDKTNASRRDFLKGSTAVAASVAVASQIGIARTAHAAGSDVIKAALIGCGGRGNGAIEDSMNADPAIKVIAVADAFEDRVQGTARRLREKRADRVDLPDDRVFSGLDAYEKAINGEPAALGSWKEFGFHLGNAIKTVVYTYDPEAVVLGGSLVKAYKFFADSMEASRMDFAFPESMKRLKIFTSQNKNIALLGAASLIS